MLYSGCGQSGRVSAHANGPYSRSDKMPKATRKINVKPAAKAAKANVAKAATAARAAITTPAAASTAAPKPLRGVTATARTIVANATHFGGLSDRDTCYLGFYAGIGKRSGGTVTLDALATLAQAGTKAPYDGSNKPHDAGVIVRLTKAGLITPAADGRGFTFTKAALTHAAYASAK